MSPRGHKLTSAGNVHFFTTTSSSHIFISFSACCESVLRFCQLEGLTVGEMEKLSAGFLTYHRRRWLRARNSPVTGKWILLNADALQEAGQVRRLFRPRCPVVFAPRRVIWTNGRVSQAWRTFSAVIPDASCCQRAFWWAVLPFCTSGTHTALLSPPRGFSSVPSSTQPQESAPGWTIQMSKSVLFFLGGGVREGGCFLCLVIVFAQGEMGCLQVWKRPWRRWMRADSWETNHQTV